MRRQLPRPAHPPRRLVTVGAALGATLLLACQSASKFAVQHSLGAELGPCAGRKDSVRALRGEPYDFIVGDEEDLSERTQLFTHEWGYRLAAADDGGAWRDDSVHVVRFRWGHEVRGCETGEYRARRLTSRLGPPWESRDDTE
jgi:hypothetical protein